MSDSRFAGMPPMSSRQAAEARENAAAWREEARLTRAADPARSERALRTADLLDAEVDARGISG